MKIIFGSDSLYAPLTGIGRYSYELACGLERSPLVTSLVGYDHGKFHPLPDRLRALEAYDAETRDGDAPTKPSLRQYLAQKQLAARVYARIMDLRSLTQRKRFREALYHSPNYHLPALDSACVTTVHDLTHHLFPELHPRARIEWMEKTFEPSLQRSSHIICQSEATRNDLVSEFSVKSDRITVVYPGVSDRFRPREISRLAPAIKQFDLSPNSYFLIVSTLEPRKNLGKTISAYLALDDAIRDRFPLALAGGDGWASDELKQQIIAAEGKGIRWLGFVSDEVLPALYSGAFCAIYPSLYEGFGLPAVEAQASGVPLIVSNRSSLPEVSNEHALSIDPDNQEAIKQALETALNDEQWRNRCREAGLLKAREFTWEKCVDGTLDVYQTVLNQ